MENENIQVVNMNLDIQLQPDGKYDLYLSDEGSSGAHYPNLELEDIAKIVTDQIQCYSEAIEQEYSSSNIKTGDVDDFDLDELVGRIDAKQEEDYRRYKLREEQENIKCKECIDKIHARETSIRKLLKLALHAEDKGMNFAMRPSFTDYKHGCFYTNGTTHQVGFYEFGDNLYLGIQNGGANGPIDFITNGKEVFSYNTKTHSIIEPDLENMEEFLRNFSNFKEQFCSFINQKTMISR